MYLVYENKMYSFILHIVDTVNLYIGVKPLIQQIEAYEKVISFKQKSSFGFVVF